MDCGEDSSKVVPADLAREFICEQPYPWRPGPGAACGQIKVIVERGMGVSVVVRSHAVVRCQRVQVGHVSGIADHVFVALVLLDDYKDVFKACDRRRIRIHRPGWEQVTARHRSNSLKMYGL